MTAYQNLDGATVRYAAVHMREWALQRGYDGLSGDVIYEPHSLTISAPLRRFDVRLIARLFGIPLRVIQPAPWKPAHARKLKRHGGYRA